ncbi:hypothetical protein A3A54_02715 [Candidatus Curtissbacteria bacterium RIFCSPLOWO2_01_FULL_39_62]|uniref:Uncharacterized protein n=2 Tax=Candidatus Curtissiibacteriota TaxID=1752717 RepID=A0A1F5GA21_9BACT|nr:MAG: hypothetical protein A2775_01515 [Candidatus Curtissbacteria bacterium RIFCSPHIGHO2_01_FULL_39_57]OGD88733.1 MAG: hypothetical protein A3D04_04215 [Candidatus Curtissbacteria bacterium RIFCSPHIGHO2_02_FULL_40_16b]OGD90277.1 MAG: hypothetical protein A3E11_01150 [Candidatus Curtissbacteria bacterium RIFCSPHIGHO2_12_FULL_38_37]OGE00636.1 MAG: hypothetical protein A3A54_02715 [Candidatus Curtissbacteria bacterium RIFCSPLOWO2_01_FULL_39_62]OGE13736.1 MAG: hypothetical protein A3G14_02675 [C
MVERDVQGEVEFWQGHSLEDNCPWQKTEESLFDKVHLLFTWSHINQAFYTLARFVRTNEGIPIKRLVHGEQLKLSGLPKGTIIRFSRDACWRQHFSYKTVSYEDEWGILTQEKLRGKFRDVIVGFSAEHLEDYYPPVYIPHMIYGDLIIGEVVHRRRIESNDPLLKPFKLDRRQTLRRTNWLEVWKFGKEVRVKEKQYAPDAQSLLNPGLTKPN